MSFLTVIFRFYEELNDFLPLEKKKIAFKHQLMSGTTVKDGMESLGVPHAEVDLILVNGVSVDFSYQVKAGDHISVYPTFESFDISPIIRLRPKPLRVTRFILDVHLGKLARYLRLLGFDTFYDNQYVDQEIIAIAQKEKRIILTRDIGLLKNKKVTHGYWLRATQPKQQIKEIIHRFDLRHQFQPFTRCLECNGKIVAVDAANALLDVKIPTRVREMQNQFYQCENCKRWYWEGTHYDKLKVLVKTFE